MCRLLRNRFLIRDCLVAPFRNRGYNMAGPMIGKLSPNDFLRLGREIARHEFQGVSCIRCKIPVQFHGIVSLQQNFGAANLFTLYRPLLDTLHFFDNSSHTPRLVFKDERGQTTTHDAALYNRLRQEFVP